MFSNIIKLVLVVAVMTLMISIFPDVYNWLKNGIDWILSFGKWGVITISSFIIGAIIGVFN